MRIFTSSWFTPLPPDIQKIGVSRGTPRGYAAGYRKMPELAPGSWFQTASLRDYKQMFFDGLARLDPAATVARMEDLGAGRDVALLCYEHPHKDADWCHRGYLAAWLHDTLRLDVLEFGLEDRGGGWQHPKIPREYRRTPARVPNPLDVAPYVGATAADEQGHIWRMIGFDPDNPDQAVIECNGERRSISQLVLEKRFRPVL